MHIVFVTVNFVDNNGPTQGLPKYLLRVSKSLIDFGHKVSVITCSNRTVSYEFYGINVYRVRRPAIKKYGNQGDDTMAMCLRDGLILKDKLDELCLKEKIDIVQYTSLAGIAYYRNPSVPSVMRLSSYIKMYTLDGREEEKKVRAELERIAALKCDSVFGPSRVVAEEFSKDIGKRVEVIESPFVMDDEQEDMSVYQDKFLNKKYILFYGSLIKDKGLNVIAEGVYRVLNEHPQLYLGIIGNGRIELFNEVKTGAKEYSDRVIYNPAISFSELKPIIRNSEAIILPSLMENLSNACIESMALGKIVVGTRGASFDQLIDDEESGFLCEIGDAGSLCDAINKALALAEEDRRCMQEKAINRAKMLSPDVVVRQLVEYYERVINNYKQDNKNKLHP